MFGGCGEGTGTTAAEVTLVLVVLLVVLLSSPLLRKAERRWSLELHGFVFFFFSIVYIRKGKAFGVSFRREREERELRVEGFFSFRFSIFSFFPFEIEKKKHNTKQLKEKHFLFLFSS